VQLSSPQQVNLAICLAKQAQHIGNIYLRDIDWIARNAELHIFIGDAQQRNKGYGRVAVQQLIDYAFRDLGLYRVYLFVLADNQAAIRTYAACGLQHEGVLRGHAFKQGAFKDVSVMGICNETVG
jgi:RimJ/RimL family protein N-acetyltransferase